MKRQGSTMSNVRALCSISHAQPVHGFSCSPTHPATYGKRERRFPMGARLCIAESAMRYLLPACTLGLSSSRSCWSASIPASMPGKSAPNRPRCQATRLRTNASGARISATSKATALRSSVTLAKAEAAHTRTQLNGSCSTTRRAGTTIRAGGPISPRAYTASRRSTGSLCSRVCAHSVIPFPR